jgi:Delta7-sterol 5-desaturase
MDFPTTWAEWLPIFWRNFETQFGRYFIAAFVTVGIVWLLKRTSWKSRQIQKRTASRSDITREFLSSIQSNIVYLVITVIMIWGMSVGIFQKVGYSLGFWNDLMMIAGIILAHDAYFYWTHRFMHHRRFYKFFHRHHHRSITPTPFAAYSFAVPEALLNAMFIPLWQLFVATPVFVLIAFLIIQIIRNTTQHAGLELHPSWWLKNPISRLVSTTTHHDMHHSGGFNYNYGFYFTFWDRLMGTEHPDYRATFDRVVGNDVTAPQPQGKASLMT